MKYVVIYQITSSEGNRGITSEKFAIKSNAVESATRWSSQGTSYAAWYWDGIGWTQG